MTFCGPYHDTVLTNRQTEKLNFDTNYITTDNVLGTGIKSRKNSIFTLQYRVLMYR